MAMPNVSSRSRSSPKTSLDAPEIIDPADSSIVAMVKAAPGSIVTRAGMTISSGDVLSSGAAISNAAQVTANGGGDRKDELQHPVALGPQARALRRGSPGAGRPAGR